MTSPFTPPARPDAPTIAQPQGNLAELIKLQGAAIVREHGEPICPSQVAAYLLAIDERLFMRAFPFPTGWEWAMCERWADTDGRRQSIRTGETPPDRDFDVIGYVPPDLKIRDAVTAKAFLVQSLRASVRDRGDFQRYLNAIVTHNGLQEARNAEPVVEYARELASANTETLFAEEGKTVARVFQSEPTTQTGTKRTKGTAADIPSPS